MLSPLTANQMRSDRNDYNKDWSKLKTKPLQRTNTSSCSNWLNCTPWLGLTLASQVGCKCVTVVICPELPGWEVNQILIRSGLNRITQFALLAWLTRMRMQNRVDKTRGGGWRMKHGKAIRMQRNNSHSSILFIHIRPVCPFLPPFFLFSFLLFLSGGCHS